MTSRTQDLARAMQHLQAGQTAQAEALCRQIVQKDRRNAEAWNVLGILGAQAGNPEAALEYFDRARAAAPNNSAYRSNRGAVLQGLGRHADAERDFREALRLNALHPEAHYNLGKALQDLKRPAEAEACYRRALELKPAFPEAWNNLGAVLHDQGRCADAEPCCRRALELRPAYPEACNNLAAALRDQGRYDEALASYRRALELNPGFAEAHYNLALVMMLVGDYEHGWSEYEWRWQVREMKLPAYPQPRWDGEPLAGKTILLHPEQGYGDDVQFVRFAPMVKQRGGPRVILHCPGRLTPLLRTCAGINEFVPEGEALPAFDTYVPLMSLPRLLSTRIETIPATVPYLAADPRLVETWREHLASIPGRKIGIVWQGSPTNLKDQQRSVPLAQFEPLVRVPGVTLCSLQLGAGQEQVTALHDRFPLVDLGSRFAASSFADAAAVMQHLDLVIGVDTALVHVAGALGVRTWVALAFAPDWRWLLEREDSPWYPTLRLFRQRRAGDWDEVFGRMAAALTDDAARRSSNGGQACETG